MSRLRSVIPAMQAFVEKAVESEGFRELSFKLVEGVERQAGIVMDKTGWMPCIDLAFDVVEACGGNPELAVPLAAASSFVFAGMDVLDDISDGDEQPQWRGVPKSHQQLVGIASLTSFPPLIIAGLPLDREAISSMQSLHAKQILLAGEGQYLDLMLSHAADASIEDIQASVMGKSGEQLALYCEWASIASGARVEEVFAWGEFGRRLGTYGQIGSDLNELVHDDWCRDLASGNRTIPIALHLLATRNTDKDTFSELLEHARNDIQAQKQVRQALLDSGAIRMGALLAQIHAGHALRALERAGAQNPARSRLEARIQGN